MSVPEPLAYLNGQTLPVSQAHVAIFDAGVVMGATVSELTRTFRQQLFRLDEHLDRLFRSLRYTGMDIGMSKEELAAVTRELVANNAKLIDPEDDLGLIHFVTAGEYPTYAGRAARTTPTICVHTFPLPFEMWTRKIQTGVHLITPSIRQVPPQCWDPKIKCRSRMHYYLAEQEARRVDPEANALLLDLAGNVTETNAANFLMVEGDTIVSPPTDKTLAGISRAMVIDLAHGLAIPFVERDFQVSNIMHATEAFLSSTPYCLMPVTKINGISIGDGQPGPVYRRLLAAWSAAVGVDIARQIEERATRRAGV